MQKKQVKATGIAWYKKENYERLKELFVDSHLLPDTLDEWLNKAQNLIDQLRITGRIVEKVDIDPDVFPEWCRGRGLDINARARADFADEFIARKYINQ